MRTESFNSDWRDYLTLYDPERFPEKYINNVQIIIAATTGHGKTLCEEKFIEEFHKAGYTILVVTEKPGAPFEMAFSAFKPRAKYHLELLEQQGITPTKKKVKLYHPMTLTPMMRNELPPINFYTIPIKSLTTQELTVLLEVPGKNYATSILSNTIKKMRGDEGMLDLIWKANRSIRKQSSKIAKGKSIPEFDEQFFIQVSAAGTEKNISHIISNFEPFMTHYMLSNNKSKYNLDWKEILRDKEHYHIFSTGFIPDSDDRIKYFVVNWLLNQIYQHQDLKRNPLLIVVQEAKVFLPNSSKEDYIVKTANNFMKKLSTMRSSGISSIADTQDYYGLSEDYRNSVNEVLLGKLHPSDLERIAKALRLSPSQKERFTRLPKNTYFKMGFEKEIAMLFPSHAHKEEGEDFFKIWKKLGYPVQNYRELFAEITQIKDEEMRKAEERQKAIVEKIKRQIKEKELEEKAREANQDDKKAVKKIEEKKEELKKDKMVLAYRQSKLNPEQKEPLSYVKLGEKYGVSDMTAKKWALEGQKIAKKESEQNPKDLKKKKKSEFYKNPAE